MVTWNYVPNKIEINLQPRYQNTFVLCKAISIHVTKDLLPKHKTANTQPTEHSTVQ